MSQALFSHVDPELLPFLRTLSNPGALRPEEIPPWTPDSGSRLDEASVPSIRRSIPAARDEVAIYVVGKPTPDPPRPAILYLHGGGFVSGDTVHSWPGIYGLKAIAREHNCTVISVDYSLAPDTPYPGALEDNYAALKWLHDNSASLGVDPHRIIVMGESAGGGHAAMLAIAARDRGEVSICSQLLIYPMLDDRTGSTQSVPRHIGAFIWTGEANRQAWSSFLGVPAGSGTVPPGSVPARVDDLRGLPPTYIGVGGLDLFVNEDIEYARRLSNAGVSVELYVAPGAYHGFFFLAPDAATSRRFVRSYKAALDAAIGN